MFYYYNESLNTTVIFRYVIYVTSIIIVSSRDDLGNNPSPQGAVSKSGVLVKKPPNLGGILVP